MKPKNAKAPNGPPAANADPPARSGAPPERSASAPSPGGDSPTGVAAPPGVASDAVDDPTGVLGRLAAVADGVHQAYLDSHRLLSFQQYLALFSSNPRRYGRCAASYVRDMFDHFGTEQVRRPWGTSTRWRLFDAPWLGGRRGAQEPTLVGQEELQAEMYRSLANFAREGRANRLFLMHGPNGSAKSTAAACVLRALEHYSTLDEGALYRFHWVFPKRVKGRPTIGFGSGVPAFELDSYAHLDEDDIDARLVIELRDHPLFLLPAPERRAITADLWAKAPNGNGVEPRWLTEGALSHKNQQIFEALLASYHGSLLDVLRHVQVERYYVSRRYRVGAVTVGPQMHVDAGERQVTADRSLAALPTALQATTLFEAYGELVEASGGLLEFADLLKRPLEAFRYLQMTLETGTAPLPQQTIYVNLVMIGACNDLQLAAFKQHPEYQSFRGRLELARVPYLRSVVDEQAIYDQQIVPQLRSHVAPHATRVAAEFAVLSRMLRPNPERYPKPLGEILRTLGAVEKLELYETGRAPARLDSESRKLLRANVEAVYRETAVDDDYEGSVGVSPRSIRTLLLDAAQRSGYRCLSPFAVLEELAELCKGKEELEWLKLDVEPGGYHDHAAFLRQVRDRLLDRIDHDMRRATALIDPAQFGELLDRYVQHVSVWVKGEKIRNPVTKRDEEPDAKMMREVETLLGITSKNDEHRRNLISIIAAWAIDHPGEMPAPREVLPDQLKRIQTAAFERLRKQYALLLRDVVTVLRDEAQGLEPAQCARAEEVIAAAAELGYCRHCTLEHTSALIGERYRELVS